MIAERRPGDIVTLRLLRNGARGDVDLRLAERPATMPETPGAGFSMAGTVRVVPAGTRDPEACWWQRNRMPGPGRRGPGAAECSEIGAAPADLARGASSPVEQSRCPAASAGAAAAG